MASTVPDWFVTQFSGEVKQAYQRRGSLLRNMVRTRSGVVGDTTRFNKLSEVDSPTSKSRHGNVPIMNASRDYVDCTLEDHYVGQLVDKLDTNKMLVDERQELAVAGSNSIGRRVDDLIVTELNGVSATNTAPGTNTALTLSEIQDGIRALNEANVDDDGERYGLVSPQVWEDMIGISEFADRDFTDTLPWTKGTSAVRWRNIIWMPFSGLPIDGSDIRSNFIFHKSAIGHAMSQDITAEINYVAEKAAWLITHMMTCGVVRIEDAGIVKLLRNES